MDKIRQMQYDNLRECIRNNLIKPILGEDYYNMGADVYTADRFVTEDIRDRYKYLFEQKTAWKYTAIFFMIANAILVIKLILS